MRPAAIAIIGFISLVVVLVFVAYVQLILLCLAAIVCLVVVLGFSRDGPGPRNFWIATARKSEADAPVPPPNTIVKIEGRTFSVLDLPERLQFTVSRRNLHLVVAIALIALGAAITCLVVTDPLKQQIEPATPRYFEFYGLCYLMVILLFPALAWFSECTLMRIPAITLANIGERNDGLRVLWIAYQFTDPSGGYYGGTTMNLVGPKGDQLKVVFCNPGNPSLNKLSCGLLFHKVEWAEDG